MAKPTIAELEEYQARQAKIDKLRSEANDLAKRQREQEDEWTPLVQKLGGKARCLVIGAFTLLVEMVRKRVDWKALYTRDMGKAAADKVMAEREQEPTLTISKAA
jgi:hypothetical protein